MYIYTVIHGNICLKRKYKRKVTTTSLQPQHIELPRLLRAPLLIQCLRIVFATFRICFWRSKRRGTCPLGTWFFESSHKHPIKTTTKRKKQTLKISTRRCAAVLHCSAQWLRFHSLPQTNLRQFCLPLAFAACFFACSALLC